MSVPEAGEEGGKGGKETTEEAKVKPILRVECKDFNIDGYHLLCQSAIKEYVIKTQISQPSPCLSQDCLE